MDAINGSFRRIFDVAPAGPKNHASVLPASSFECLFRRPTGLPDNHPSNIHSTVKVAGKTVATLYNSGAVAMTNEAAARVGSLESYEGQVNGGGPLSAQSRAEYIASRLGGTVEIAATAIEQHVWKPTAVHFEIDLAEMEEKLRSASARMNANKALVAAAFTAQQLASQTDDAH